MTAPASNRVYIGDCRDTLRALAAQGLRAQTCVTSPPYWGLRDYGHPGQLGLERTPEEYVAAMVDVFRAVRNVLADDGTLWLNLGDSYAASSNTGGTNSIQGTPKRIGAMTSKGHGIPTGCKPKDLVGIPWSVAKALQAPYYTGRIKRPEDRIWLAAMIDGEGCLFIHKRKAGADSGARYTKADGSTVSYARTADTYGAGLEVANTHIGIVERCQQITGLGTITTQDKDRRQTLFRWHLRGNEARDITREVYPYLVAKQHQARLLCGCPSNGERASAAHQALIGLHGGTPTDVDFPAPASMFEPGYYLRSDIIWAKANPMPESVTDRPTKAHEYLFLMAKAERYYYDAKAIAEPAIHVGAVVINGNGKNGQMGQYGQTREGFLRDGGVVVGDTRNRRSVWTVATQPYSGAHFATFPPALIEPCILAGSRPGDVVLDPFFGSGTTGMVAQRLGRQWVGCELNPDYVTLADERTAGTIGMAL